MVKTKHLERQQNNRYIFLKDITCLKHLPIFLCTRGKSEDGGIIEYSLFVGGLNLRLG